MTMDNINKEELQELLNNLDDYIFLLSQENATFAKHLLKSSNFRGNPSNYINGMKLRTGIKEKLDSLGVQMPTMNIDSNSKTNPQVN